MTDSPTESGKPSTASPKTFTSTASAKYQEVVVTSWPRKATPTHHAPSHPDHPVTITHSKEPGNHSVVIGNSAGDKLSPHSASPEAARNG
ncbi:Uncharacterised protein [Mycobacteroides abscessus subsp. abscessus]|nr:Uncharacterised protein [Mycobacteroides abscessus subsp. abscessus]